MNNGASNVVRSTRSAENNLANMMSSLRYAYCLGMKQMGVAIIDEPTLLPLLENVYNTFKFTSFELLALQVGHNEGPFVHSLDQNRADYFRAM